METLNVEEDELASKEIVIQKYFLKEWNVVKSLLDSILSIGRVSDMSVVYKIRSIVDKYQEQGQLIEPYLENTVTPLMLLICLRTREMGTVSDEVLGVIKPLCIIIYSLVTVCGHKAVVKFFPHHVSDLELAVALLDACHGKDVQSSLRYESTGEMEAKCVILLWLSILVLVPFDICSIDSGITNVNCTDKYEQSPLVLKLTEIAKQYLSVNGPMCTIAGLLIARLITRPDMRQDFASFVEWAHEIVSSFKDDAVEHFRLLGVVNALAAVFQVGSKKSLIDVVPVIWNDISKLINSSSAFRSPLLRKVLMKLVQRIGLTCLPRRLPSWHYVKNWTTISLELGESADCNLNASYFVPEMGKNDNEEEVIDVPDMVEEIIDMLLSGLRDTDTVVRWSAAKGIGRLTSFLSASQSDEVFSSLLDLFSLHEGDGSWHGGCLALAELSRRGLLLPTSFPKVFPVLVKALHYDVRRGAHSVGSQVRDAAAYVCWAFGRAYCQSDMKDIINGLAPYLLRVACYDREVNCRRAAAAAFQENVGRQGSYSNGIEIVNSANYFSLSSRSNSYLNVAVYIAQFEGFFHPFVDELLHRKILHWDKGLRELASHALSVLVQYDPGYFVNVVLEELIPLTLSSDLCTRHGATLAVAELVFALHKFGYIFSSEMQERIVHIVSAIETANLYHGKGGEIMRLAVSRFIECLSLARLTLSEKLIQNLMDNLSENICHPNPQIQNAAVGALKHFVSTYIVGFGNQCCNDVTVKYVEKLSDANTAARRGSALAIGILPYECLATSRRDVLLRLCKSCLVEENPADRDAESRVNAVKALVSVCETLCEVKSHTDDIYVKDNMSLYLLIKNEVMLSLFRALDDYSIDSRGDVGSWVREAALFGLERCTYLLCEKDSTMCSLGEFKASTKHCSVMQPLFDEQLASTLVGVIIKQAVEKMDKLREAASNILWRILYNERIFIPSIPFREKLEEVVPKSADSKWSVPSFSYSRLVQLLQFSCYSKFVLSGLVTSTGGLQDSLRKASMMALTEYIQEIGEEDSVERSRVSALCADIIRILQHYKKCDRVIIPTLKTIEILSSKRLLNIEDGSESSFYNSILDCLAAELKGCKHFSKLYTGISILGYISSSFSHCCIQRKAFSQLLNYLSHRYPKIRKCSAEQVYLVLLQNENIIPAANNMEKALEIVSETCWDGDIQHAKQHRQQLLVLVDLKVGVPLQTHVSRASTDNMRIEPTSFDENEAYSALVGSKGY